MYLKEGISSELAAEKAKKMHKELDTYAKHEVYFWKRIRGQEEPVGLDVEAYLTGDDRVAITER
jgi:hypothetical protein